YADDRADPPFQEWLARHCQTPRTVERFWGLVLVSALNESPERVGLRYARKVFVDGFLRHRQGFEVDLPVVPLGRLYGEQLQTGPTRHQIQVQLQAGGRALKVDDDKVTGLEMRTGEVLDADWYIAAAPFDRLLDLLPAAVVERHVYFQNLKRLETSPI